MFDLLAPVGDFLRRTGIVAPVAVGAAGALGVAVARHNAAHAPVVVGIALAFAVAAAALRQRGAALAALGVASCAAFATPEGLGPLLVACGAVIAARPSSADRRVAAWPEVVDALVALPGVAGLAGVVAAEPSERAGVIAAASVMVLVGSWWRGPRHDAVAVTRPTPAAYLAVVAAVALVLAPEHLGRLGAMPAATRTAGRGAAAGLAVVAVVCVIEGVRQMRAAQAELARVSARRRISTTR
ncbi:MAG: hypothetical protein QOJ00_2715 [Actinomycetota bacterium]